MMMEQEKKLTQELLHRLIRHELEEQKRKKPQCSRGNPNFDQRGRWTSPDKDRGSWSLKKNEPYDPDCRSGVAQRPFPSSQQRTTRVPCGRSEDGRTKAKWKCKDGTPSHTPSPITEDEMALLQDAKASCSECWGSFLRSLNQASRAQKGKLYDKPAGQS
jgi:hypothetical protein